ncbi:hypothetical protein GQ600_18993 [Phytophthora cactorum]|nr:hypothetical protein GQ600_18993 [Phytophthora cactorum]
MVLLDQLVGCHVDYTVGALTIMVAQNWGNFRQVVDVRVDHLATHIRALINPEYRLPKPFTWGSAAVSTRRLRTVEVYTSTVPCGGDRSPTVAVVPVTEIMEPYEGVVTDVPGTTSGIISTWTAECAMSSYRAGTSCQVRRLSSSVFEAVRTTMTSSKVNWWCEACVPDTPSLAAANRWPQYRWRCTNETEWFSSNDVDISTCNSVATVTSETSSGLTAGAIATIDARKPVGIKTLIRS